MVLCCFGKKAYRKCMCRPYRDERLLSAQIWSIIAAIPSAINFIPFSLSLIAVVWFQMLCCFRVSKGNLQWLILLSMATAISIICSGLFAAHDWGPYFLDDPNYTYLLITCIISGFMWIVIAFKVVFFVDNGDYGRFEELLDAAARRQESDDDSDEYSDGDDEVDIQTNRFDIPEREYNETARAIRVFLEQREPSDLEALSVSDEIDSSVVTEEEEEGNRVEEGDIESIQVQASDENSYNDDIEVGANEVVSDCSCDLHEIIETNTEETSITARDSATSWTDDSSRRRSVALEINQAGQIFHVSRSLTFVTGERNDGRFEDSMRGRHRTLDAEEMQESHEQIEENSFTEP